MKYKKFRYFIYYKLKYIYISSRFKMKQDRVLFNKIFILLYFILDLKDY